MNVQRANVILLLFIGLLLIGLCLPGVRLWRENAARTQTRNQLRHLAETLHAFHDNWLLFPPIFGFIELENAAHPLLRHAVSFHVHLLPFVGQDDAYRTFLVDGNGQTDARIPAFLSDSDGTLVRGESAQCFAANLRAFSTKGAATHPRDNIPPLSRMEPGRQSIRSFLRGTTQQIILAPKLAECSNGGSRYAADPTSPYAAYFGQNAARTVAHYSDPTSIFQWAPRGDECLTTPLMAQNYLPAPLPVAFCDGSVRNIAGDFNPGLWNRFLSPSME